MLFALLMIFTAGAYAQDCSEERISRVTETCRMELRERISVNFTADCIDGVVQDYVDCLTEISTCTDVPGITELTLSQLYGFRSTILRGLVADQAAAGPSLSGECSLGCSCCPFSCTFKCTIEFRRSTSDSSTGFKCDIGKFIMDDQYTCSYSQSQLAA